MSKQTDLIIAELKAMGDNTTASHSQRFFKTGKGEYGEGDIFLGIRVPVIRKCVKEFKEVSIDDVFELLESRFHEARLLAVLMLVRKYSHSKDDTDKNLIYRSYLTHTKYINNWDIVDSSANHIVGAYLFDRDRKILYNLAQSKSLWERRIAITATFHFIREEDYADTLAISEILLHDGEDLIHKAVGWMLREVGKRDRKTEDEFLTRHYRTMPRTMLRYAIEKHPEAERQAYLTGLK